MKKGAMFGLDARIALSIFGALSVISGAALYSAIQESKTTKTLANFTELSKAWEQYLLDTGSTLPKDSGDLLKVKNLASNVDNKSGWNGPYISYNVTSDYVLDHPEYLDVHFFQALKTENWGDTTTWTSAGAGEVCSVGDENCSVWIQFTKVPGLTIAQSLDEKLDGGDGYSKGNFRVITNQTSPNYYIYHLASIGNL